MWLSRLSSERVTAAMPPWAQRLAEGGLSCLLSSRTRNSAGNSRQVIRPAAPLPTTTTSHWSVREDAIAGPCYKRAYGNDWRPHRYDRTLGPVDPQKKTAEGNLSGRHKGRQAPCFSR